MLVSAARLNRIELCTFQLICILNPNLLFFLGGQERVRPLWRTFARGAEGIMFVLDSADVSTLEEARLELTHILKHADTSSLPILVLANKQDRTEACDPAYLKFFLLGGNDTVKSSDAIQIQGACAITGQGLDESLDMLYEMILNARKKSSSTSPGKQHHNQHHSKRSIR